MPAVVFTCPPLCLHARRCVYMPAKSFYPSSCLHARYFVLLVIFFLCPPFCLHARRLPVILFTCPPFRSLVYMPAIVFTCPPNHSTHHLVYVPAVLFTYPPFCLHARRSVYMPAESFFHLIHSARHLVYRPAISTTCKVWDSFDVLYFFSFEYLDLI